MHMSVSMCTLHVCGGDGFVIKAADRRRSRVPLGSRLMSVTSGQRPPSGMFAEMRLNHYFLGVCVCLYSIPTVSSTFAANHP